MKGDQILYDLIADEYVLDCADRRGTSTEDGYVYNGSTLTICYSGCPDLILAKAGNGSSPQLIGKGQFLLGPPESDFSHNWEHEFSHSRLIPSTLQFELKNIGPWWGRVY